MASLLKYPGGKWQTADWIISYFPEHKVYCEPFFGSENRTMKEMASAALVSFIKNISPEENAFLFQLIPNCNLCFLYTAVFLNSKYKRKRQVLNFTLVFFTFCCAFFW